MAFVLIQHLDPSHESMLTEIIAKTTKMPVEEVKSGVVIQPNRIYVIPPNALMALANGVFQLSPRSKTPGQHLAVNFFMHSLAKDRKSGAIAIVLSGTGADGTAGMEDIKAEGGITFVQDPATAKYDGMPRSVIDSGCADFILAPKDMAKELRRIQNHPYVHLEKPEEEEAAAEKPGAEESGAKPQDLGLGRGLANSDSFSSHARDFSAVLAQLRKSSGVDFSQYKPNTIHRRALRRMLLLKVDSLRDSGKSLKSLSTDRDELDLEAEADRLVLREHAPVGVVINREMEVVQFRGQTTPYLAPPPGKPSLNVLKLARNGLAIELRSLITAATKKGGAARKDGIAFDENGYKRMLNLSVTPLGDKRFTENGARDRYFFLILFEDVTQPLAPAVEAPSQRKLKGRNQSDQDARRQTQELASTRDALRSAIESEDSLKEEFQSANEEILSANEELQSTNEELETSKEELQSANEELTTLNAELRNKNNELHDLSNDILNLLNSTRIPVVMLDRRLYIRRITPAATKLFKVVPADIGRPFADIKLNIKESDITSHDLELEITKVLDNLRPIEREVRDLEGCWHELRVLPYRTQDNKIDGVVLALQDIDAVKRSQQNLQTIIENIPTPLLVLDGDLRVRFANETFCATFQVSGEETVGQLLYLLGNEQWKVPALTELLEKVLPERKLVKNFSVTHEFPRIGRKTMLVSGRRIEDVIGQRAPLILLTIEDVTERKDAEIALARLAAIVECSDDAIIAKNLDGVIQTWNRGAEKLFGYTAEETVGQSVTMLMPPDRVGEESVILGRLRRGEHIDHYEAVRRRKDGRLLDVSLTISPIVDEHSQIVGASKIARDIGERKLTEAALIKSEKMAAAGRLAATLAHEINNPLQAVANLVTIWARSPGLDEQGQAYAAMAESELRRLSHLTQQSLSFYRESIVPIPVNVEETIDSVLRIYEKRIESKGIRLTSRYQAGAATIKTYPGEIRQVFSTLLLNAMEAVDAGGSIGVRVRKASHWHNPAIQGVRITVSDNGVGIPESNLPHIFEPFFTTKGENGTGLGLWVASGIVDRFGGSIRTRSSVHPDRHGTCFSIFLPAKA